MFFVSGIFGGVTWRPGATGGTPCRVALLCFACSLFRLSDRWQGFAAAVRVTPSRTGGVFKKSQCDYNYYDDKYIFGGVIKSIYSIAIYINHNILILCKGLYVF